MALTDAVGALIDQQNWRERTRLAAALARWSDIAGPDVAAHVVAESFDEGVLTLRADSTAWATQMRLLLPTIRTRIDAEIGRGVVADISVKGPTAPVVGDDFGCPAEDRATPTAECRSGADATLPPRCGHMPGTAAVQR